MIYVIKYSLYLESAVLSKKNKYIFEDFESHRFLPVFIMASQNRQYKNVIVIFDHYIFLLLFHHYFTYCCNNYFQRKICRVL